MCFIVPSLIARFTSHFTRLARRTEMSGVL